MRILKGIVFTLVLANVAYFLWAHGIAPPSGGSRLAAVPRLTLASEAAASAPSSAPASAAASSATASSAAEPAAVAPAMAGASSAGSNASSASSASGGSSPPASGDAESAAVAASPAPIAAKRCISVGPFLDVTEAARAAATLRHDGYRPKQRVAEGEVWAGVWVYLDLPPTPAAIARLRAKLAKAGIKDALEMPGPSDATVISLGLYSESARAQARVAYARTLGLQPHVAERNRSGDVYWIDVDLKPTDQNPSPSDLGGAAGRIVRLQVVSCPGT